MAWTLRCCGIAVGVLWLANLIPWEVGLVVMLILFFDATRMLGGSVR